MFGQPDTRDASTHQPSSPSVRSVFCLELCLCLSVPLGQDLSLGPTSLPPPGPSKCESNLAGRFNAFRSPWPVSWSCSGGPHLHRSFQSSITGFTSHAASMVGVSYSDCGQRRPLVILRQSCGPPEPLCSSLRKP